MRIGYACIPLGVNYKTTRSFTLKNFTHEKFNETVKLNIEDLLSIIEYNKSNGILMFRISSDIIPFGSHNINYIKWEFDFKDELKKIGDYIKNCNMRVSMHPGQYTVLNSPNIDVVEKSIRDIEYHTKFMDALEVDYSNKIVLHVGGVYGDRILAMERFENNFKLLSGSAKRRIVIENDERCFNIEEVLSLASAVNIPAVFDILHDKVNSSANHDLKLILKEVEYTWEDEDGKMKLHYSDQAEDKKTGAHSQFVLIKNFMEFYNMASTYEPDIMLEVKDKDISAIKCVNSIYEPTNKVKTEQWAKYKYLVMEKSYGAYKKCSSIIKNDEPMVKFYSDVDEALLLHYDEGAYINTLQHVWGYFKDKATAKEIEDFFAFVEKAEYLKAKKFLYRLSNKYKVDYLTSSYYFLDVKK